ncbi:MAG TPA: translocation/assembly module TamB domain-containing protein [Chitinophaga sp.]|uniref:translocation/assembly module TamB domain-containing protein n=1 Tax=Chitinophaga sp. TaxID=1869181 RepID=UPI002B674250|nr:translocation/assembly module TamB domain-containing protein [Chitinophaga sp.]HVI49301.1 translocation/assembly module TamB domain-containing protein [Chitinophaga sp.]
MTEPTETVERRSRPWWRWLLWIVVAVLLLPVMAVLLLQLNGVQNYLRQQGEIYLQKKLKTKVQIGYLRARGWQYLELRNVYVADTSHQALFYTGSLKVHYNLFSFISNELQIDKLEWDSLLVNAYRHHGDSAFNFQFAVDAFVHKSEVPDTIAPATGTTMQFRIKDVSLKHTKVSFIDDPGGMSAVVTWTNLHLDPDDLLVSDGVYSFRGIVLDGLRGFFRQAYIAPAAGAAPPPSKTDTGSTAFHLLLKKLQITNSTFLYASDGIGITTAWKIGDLQLRNTSLDQDSTRIQVGSLAINNTVGTLAMVPGKDTTPAPKDAAPNTWQVFATQVNLDRLAFRYDNGPAPKAAGPDPDYNHLLLTNFYSRISNVKYKPDSTSVDIKSLTVRERSGFAIRKTNMQVLFTPQNLVLQNFLLQTNKSIFRKHISVTVPSWSGISDHLDQLGIDANLDSVEVALDEWLPFVPGARSNKSFAPLWNKQLTLAAILKGSLSQLDIKHLYVNDHGGNIIKAENSQIMHAADPDRLEANLPELYIESGNKPLRSWVPPHTIPDTPRLPEHIIITGMFKGGMKNILTQLQLKSDIASASVNAHLVNITDSINGSYDINIPFFRVHPGIMLSDTALGWIAGSLNANGQGYTLKQMAANATAQLNEATYNGYTYRDINLKAALNRGAFSANGETADTSFISTFDIRGNIADTAIKALKMNLDLTNANLYATRWYSEPLTLKGSLNADFNSLDPRRIEGSALLTDWQILTKGQIFPLDSIALVANYSDQQYLSLKSPLGTILANGNIDYTKIGAAFSSIISKPLQPADSGRIITVPADQHLAWTASLLWPSSLQPLLPQLRMDVPLEITGRLNSDSSLLFVNATLPKVSYDSLHADSIKLFAHIADTSFKTDVSLARLYHPTFPLYHTSLTAQANSGVVDFDLLMDDVKNKPKYKLGGLLSFLSDNVMLLSLKSGLLLNKQEWTVADNNILRMKNGNPDTANIKLSQGGQSIQVGTIPDTSTTPALQAKVSNFQLSTITGMLASDTLLANGILNADGVVRSWAQTPLVQANLKLDSLTVKNVRIGTLDATVSNDMPNQYLVKATLQGNENDMAINGTYDSTINAQVNINHLNMAILEPFTMGYISRMHGGASGKFDISGTPGAPLVRGSLHFNNATGTINYIGSTLHLPDEDIVIDEKGILLNNLVIADSLKNELVVNGRINTTDFTNYNFLLDVNADNFMALGEQQKPDQWLYGPAFIDSKVKIRGNLDLPRVDAAVKLRDKSSVTFIIPQENPGVADREGIIEFVDKSNPVDSALLAKQDSSKYSNPKLKGVIFSGNLEITPQSTIKIVIDSQNGDYVQAKGTANLNATLDPSSKMSITGRYEISEGKYEMSLNQLIKRSFDIQKGSFISFNGDAMSADLDITAKYTVNAPAIDLVQDQLSTKSAEDRNKYKQRIPFEVYLMIKGNMKKPDISFRLDMPEKERNLFEGTPYNKLKQINQVPSELNKQVMGLLVLNTFIPEDPMSTLDNTGGGVGQAARNSVSKILSQQLNNLAGNLIKGVDLNFDLQSKQDYSSGTAQEKTNLNIGASKNLFNDRLTVSVGSNILLTGNQQNTSSLVGDISVDYKLTRDGRYKIRVYQRNDNQTVIEGQLIETGVAFMLVMDYDEFREIFQRSKRDRRAEKLRDNKKNKKNK